MPGLVESILTLVIMHLGLGQLDLYVLILTVSVFYGYFFFLCYLFTELSSGLIDQGFL